MKILLIAVVAYISTDIDDFFINLILYTDVNSKKDEINLILGKYIGMTLLVLVSLLSATSLQYFFESYTKYLGFIPIYLGIKQVLSIYRNEKEEEVPTSTITLWSITSITIASGADNIGVYIPLFSSMSGNEKCITIIVFMVMTWICCYLAKKFVQHPSIQTKLVKYKKIIVPLVYFVLGIYILAK